MPPSDPEFELTEAENAYLRSCIANYRNTPSKHAKEEFRENCVRYIMRERSLPDHPFTFRFWLGKVRNWFQNHATKVKPSRLPLKVNKDFTGKRVHKLQNEAKIRQGVTEREAEGDGANRRLANWNATGRELWDELPEDEKRAYDLLASQWKEDGPDVAIKPLLAEKRAPKWMRSVSVLFWEQCNMPIFIYGMYKDSNGGLHATVYDTSNLWREMDKSAPLLRNVPGWDQDFRRVVWTFFQPTLRPDLATPEALQLIKAAKRTPPARFEFSFYDDGCPILVDQHDGQKFNNSRRQAVFRDYMRLHYSLAAGTEKRSPPWTSMASNASNFFEEGMLPDVFAFQDPSHITDAMLIPFFKHVIAMEGTMSSDSTPRRFRFFQYETGSGEHKMYHPAVYNGTVTPAAPCRTQKTVSVPQFLDPPTPPPGSSTPDTRMSQSPLPDDAAATSPMGAAIAAGLEAARAQIITEKAAVVGGVPARRREALPRPATRVKRTAVKLAAEPPSTSLPPPAEAAEEPWLEAEIDAGDQHLDYDSDLTEDVWLPDDGENGDGSDDEVEDFLIDSTASEGDEAVPLVATFLVPRRAQASTAGPSTSTAPAGTKVKRPSAASTPLPSSANSDADDRSPSDVAAKGEARLEFLQGLAKDDEYVEMLGRVHESLLVTTAIRALSPVFWATWGHKSTNIPVAIHTSEKKMRQLVTWICKDREQSATAVDIQRFCLVVGITLRDLALIADADGTDIWPEHVPGFLARSSLDASQRDDILAACADAFVPPVEPERTRKGKAKAKTYAAHPAPGENVRITGVRRSSRAAAR